MYKGEYSDKIVKKILKIQKKDLSHYKKLKNKIDWIRVNSNHKYKNLRNVLKDYKRVHLGHFVLIFKIDHVEKKVYFEDYDHHDKIYD